MANLALNTMRPYSGSRAAIDLSAAYLDADRLFDAHKARVLADGGKILNESSCRDEIAFIISVGLWDSMASVAAPEWGVKQDGLGNVVKIYGLGKTPDYTATQVGTAIHPVILDTTKEIPMAVIRLDSGGSQLVSGDLVLQAASELPYLVSIRGLDYDTTDNQGIAMRFNGPNWPHFIYWSVHRNNQKFNWFYACDQFNPPIGAGGASASGTWNGTIGKSAALVSHADKKLTAYEHGLFSSESSTFPPPDISGIRATITLGARYANEEAGEKIAYGGIGRVRAFSICNDIAAALISNRT